MARRRRSTKDPLSNVIVVSDTHCGCRAALCPADGASLDEGGRYIPSNMQLTIWKWWTIFWKEWVPEVTRGEPFAVVHNGDIIDGDHHHSTTQISHNLEDQAEIAYRVMAPVVDACNGNFYQIRGTEAHVGKSAVEEERLAKRLGAIPNKEGQFARYELWLRVGGKELAHLAHHVGTAGSMHYESSALMRELTEAYVEAGRWNDEPPSIVARSHRHRNAEVRVRTFKGFATCFTTPAWQLKTSYAYKIAGARQSLPQIGGSLIRMGDEEMYTRHQVWSLSRPEVAEL